MKPLESDFVETNKNIFNLTKQFALLSFFCILVIGVVSTILVSKLITEKILLRDAILSSEFVGTVIASEGTWHLFLGKQDFKQKVKQDVPTNRRESNIIPWALESFFTHVALMPDVVRTNVYGKNRCVLWSSTPTLIGEYFNDNDELEAALQGELIYGSGIVGGAGKGEHVQFEEKLRGLRFVETYIPVWNRNHSEVLGAVELYRIPRMLHQSIVEAQRFVWIGAIVGGLLLFFSLYWIVRRAAMVMESQQQRLVETKSLSVIGQTASAFTHAMRNPLSSIRACAELSLTDDLEGVRESARDIMNETDRLDRWAREFLLFSVTNSETPEHLDLNELVQAVLKEHEPLLKRLAISCHLHLAAKSLVVAANFIPLSQAFGSLIMNAVEAMGENGELTLTTSHDPIKNFAGVSFTDTGPGLSREIKDRLFQPFVTTKPTGTGLGLALSRHLVEHYDGRLEIDSEPGRGVTVKVYLPISEKPQRVTR